VPEQLEVPGDHKPIAAIVAPAAGDRRGPVDAEAMQEPGHASPGILHEHDPGQTKLLDRKSIDLPNLGASERVHDPAIVLDGQRRLHAGAIAT